MDFYNIIGILMVFSGALYSLPQVLRSIKRGNSKGVSLWFIIFWMFDKIVSLIYVSHLGDYPLTIKYGIAAFFVAIILWYKRND